MAPTPGSAVFPDTNILIYSSFPGAPFHDTARERLGELEREAVGPPPTLDAPTRAVRQFEAEFEIADEDAAVTAILPDLLKSRTVRGKQIHDTNIVATMRRYGIPLLLTHGTADFTRYVPDITSCR